MTTLTVYICLIFVVKRMMSAKDVTKGQNTQKLGSLMPIYIVPHNLLYCLFEFQPAISSEK
jgi:hypothetical protein